MAPTVSFLISGFYLVMAAAIAIHEYKIISTRGGDSFTVVVIFVLIYLLIPSAGIYSLLGLYGNDLRTGNYFFDKVISRLDFVESMMVFLLTVVFTLGLYFTRFFPAKKRSTILPMKELRLRRVAAYLSLGTLTLICGTFFFQLGDSVAQRYANLILFRSQHESSVRTFFSANAFSLTQTLMFLAAGVFFIYQCENKRFRAMAFFVLMLLAAILMGSRRGFIFPVVIIYLSFVLLRRNVYWQRMMLVIPVVVIWLGFGKEWLGSFAYDVDAGRLLGNYDSLGSMLLRSFSEIGISQIQSLAVFQHFEITARLGTDHLLSVLRRIPDGMIGLEIDWPERIVRKTTKVFTSSAEADIPPGLIGQSWLDFPVLGAFLWGVFIGLQALFVNRLSSRLIQSPSKISLIVLASVIIALPINTGSLDYTFTVDIMMLVLLLGVLFRSVSSKSCHQLVGTP